MKSFVRFFLSLCVLLVIGSGHLNAHWHQEKTRHATFSRNKGSAHADLYNIRTEHVGILRSGHSGSGRKQNRSVTVINESQEEEDDDEDKHGASRRIKEAFNHFIASFYAPEFSLTHCSLTELPPPGNTFISPTFRHIFIRVIRI
ncbi:hypothetical protein [Flavihumibacter solisilvae]|uniref:Uncharacterized protein n=1 Tax=Flavihumibacter solisilvae TaxID=1349421 RepID=A0A0C1IFV9_9BACT|nr:hypothetical protein [Flavihumibacter solisilvae]KIC93015.1 hypothetical protein OI18_19900 [Flavihumibacter solisilvae]